MRSGTPAVVVSARLKAAGCVQDVVCIWDGRQTGVQRAEKVIFRASLHHLRAGKLVHILVHT